MLWQIRKSIGNFLREDKDKESGDGSYQESSSAPTEPTPLTIETARTEWTAPTGRTRSGVSGWGPSSVSAKAVSGLQRELLKTIATKEGYKSTLESVGTQALGGTGSHSAQSPANLVVTNVRTILRDPGTDERDPDREEIPPMTERLSRGRPSWESRAQLLAHKRRNQEIICELEARIGSHDFKVKLDLQDMLENSEADPEISKLPFYPWHWELSTVGAGRWRIACSDNKRLGFTLPLVELTAQHKAAGKGETQSDDLIPHTIPESGFASRLKVWINGNLASEEENTGDRAAPTNFKQ